MAQKVGMSVDAMTALSVCGRVAVEFRGSCVYRGKIVKLKQNNARESALGFSRDAIW